MLLTLPVVVLITGTWLTGNAHNGYHHNNPHPDTLTNVTFQDDPRYFCLEGEKGCGSDTAPCEGALG